jgi:2-polyprenyl-6-methoxyphenol hydroxylase-like FAD-dependent oxidoreductase
LAADVPVVIVGGGAAGLSAAGALSRRGIEAVERRLLQRLHTGIPVGVGRGAAVVAILALEAYLVLAPSSPG